jgi:uncharacterized cupin superfamily protein
MTTPKPPALDPATVPVRSGTGYPEPFRALVARRQWQALGDALGLKNFGVNLVRLAPGVASSQRHWHTHEDEFVFLLEGELALVTSSGEQTLRAGMAAGFPAGVADGHHFVNRSQADAVFLVVGDRREEDECRYPDIDLDLRHVGDERDTRFTRKDGTPY